jgi:hypothetical protein
LEVRREGGRIHVLCMLSFPDGAGRAIAEGGGLYEERKKGRIAGICGKGRKDTGEKREQPPANLA